MTRPTGIVNSLGASFVATVAMILGANQSVAASFDEYYCQLETGNEAHIFIEGQRITVDGREPKYTEVKADYFMYADVTDKIFMTEVDLKTNSIVITVVSADGNTVLGKIEGNCQRVKPG